MKIVFNINDIKKAMNVMNKVISPNSPSAAMRCVRVSTWRQQDVPYHVTLVGTSGDATIMQTVPLADAEDLKMTNFLLDAKLLGEIINGATADSIELDYNQDDKTKVAIEAGNAHYRLQLQNIDDFPKVKYDNFTGGELKNIKVSFFNDVLDKVGFCVPNKESLNRMVLTGVNFSADNGRMSAAGTDDSYRLAEMTGKAPNGVKFNFTIPINTLKLIPVIFKDDTKKKAEGDNEESAEKKLNMVVTDKEVFFTDGKTNFVSRLLDGAYPDISRLIPTAFSRTVTVNRQELLNALTRTMVITFDDKARYIVSLEITENQILIKSDSQEIGSVEEPVECHLEGKNIQMYYLTKYLVEALKSFEAPEVTFSIVEDNRPAKITAAGENLVQVVLPTRVYR